MRAGPSPLDQPEGFRATNNLRYRSGIGIRMFPSLERILIPGMY
jgi:hypothetical protein